MLTRLRAVAVVWALVVGSTAFGFVAPADAQPRCGWVEVGKDADGKALLEWRCEDGDDDRDPGTGGGGGGGTNEPPCDLSGEFDEFCDPAQPTSACWGNDPARVQEPQRLEGVPKPDPEAHVAYKSCRAADGTFYDEWFWSTGEDTGPTLLERAQAALGRLALPGFTPTFNPPTRTLVNLDTWWWADGAAADEVVSSAALGVRAVATPDRMEVDPGDGTGVMACPVVTERSDACRSVYRRSSDNAGAVAENGTSAYPARMRLVYSVAFEMGGDPIEVDGAPDEIETDWVERAVPVREAQTVVIPR